MALCRSERCGDDFSTPLQRRLAFQHDSKRFIRCVVRRHRNRKHSKSASDTHSWVFGNGETLQSASERTVFFSCGPKRTNGQSGYQTSPPSIFCGHRAKEIKHVQRNKSNTQHKFRIMWRVHGVGKMSRSPTNWFNLFY